MEAGENRFEFATAGRIAFGWDQLDVLPDLVASHGERVLVVCGSKLGRVQPCLDRLKAQGKAVACFQVRGEPSIEQVQEGVLRAREGFDWLLGFGGGSVIDAAKAIAIMARQSGEVSDHLELVGGGKPLEGPGLPLVAVPTTAGTGSEVTRNAVLTSHEHRLKVSMRHPSMLPTLALVDPALTVSCPPALAACTGLDALTQLIEPFISCKANPLTDAFCRQGIPLVVRSIRRVHAQDGDRKAFADMALASLLGGLALANAGLGAVHGIAGPFGGMFAEAPHGAVCAALLPASLEINHRVLRERYPQHPCHLRFEELAGLMLQSPDARFEDALDWVRETVEQLKIPSLSSHGMTSDALSELLGKAEQASSMKGNPVPLSTDELCSMVNMAM
jgi:alcohol dehydrogenase class IV